MNWHEQAVPEDLSNNLAPVVVRRHHRSSLTARH